MFRRRLGRLGDSAPAHPSRLTKDSNSTVAELRSLFLHLWSKAHDCPDYDKEEWMRLRGLLFDLGIDL